VTITLADNENFGSIRPSNRIVKSIFKGVNGNVNGGEANKFASSVPMYQQTPKISFENAMANMIDSMPAAIPLTVYP